jgi:hypothetical protein
MFEIVLGMRTRGEEDDVGVVWVWGELAECIPLVLEVGGESAHLAGAEFFGEDTQDDEAVFAGVAGSGWCLGMVGEDLPLAAGVTGEIGGMEDEVLVLCRVEVVGWIDESRVGVED